MLETSTANVDTDALYLDGSYAEVNPDWHQADSKWKAERIVKMMARHSLDVHSVCEVGCGAGEILVCLQKQLSSGTRIVGYEPSPQAFHIASSKATAGLSFVQGASVDGSEHFDLMLLIDVIEHISDYLGALRTFRKSARYFIFHIPLDLSVLSVLREWPLIKRRRKVGHLHYFTKKTAIASLTDTGYSITDFFYTEINRPEERRSVTTILLRRLPLWIMSHLGFMELGVRIFGDHSLLILATAEPGPAVDKRL